MNHWAILLLASWAFFLLRDYINFNEIEMLKERLEVLEKLHEKEMNHETKTN